MKVMTLNTAIFPWGLRQFSGDDKVLRARDIAKQIIDLRPDIVCLQELFEGEAASALFSVCQSVGYHVNYKPGFWIGSGLATLSLKPILETTDIDIDGHGSILSRFLCRPVQKTVLEGGLAVYNLHLSPAENFPWFPAWHKWCVKGELRAVSREVVKWQMETGNPWIVAGDYNWDSVYFANVTKFKKGTIDKKRMYLAPFLIGKLKECIDHIASSSDIPIRYSRTIKSSSDHLAVLATIEI